MAGLQTTIGLISGIPIQETVEKLIAIDAIPKTNLEKRTDILRDQQQAYLDLTALFNTSTYMMKNLGKVDIYSRRDVKSSNESVLKATRSGSPVDASYSFTPLKMAQAQTTLLQGVASDSKALGKEGDVTIRFGRDLGVNYDLKDINGGEGFERGYIRITDGSGTRASIDLRTAQSVQDVIEAINNSTNIDVFASLDGDHIVLTDYSGGTGTMTVQEVNNGKTAESLGLKGVTAENGVITGKNLIRLGENTELSLLNDGTGLLFDAVLSDLTVELADGTSINIDFNAMQVATDTSTPQSSPMKTVGELIAAFNKAGNVDGTQKMVAGFSADGKRLVIKDNTTGSGTFTITQDEHNGATIKPILYKLGLCDYGQSSATGTKAADGTSTIGSRDLIGGIDSVLMSSLNGGRGFPMSEVMNGQSNVGIGVQDRNGNRSFIFFTEAELRSAQTLEDMVKLVNGKMKDVVLLDPNDANWTTPLYEKDADGNPIYQYYDNGDPKYYLDSNNRLPLKRDENIKTSNTQQAGLLFGYDDSTPPRVKEYKYALTPEEITLSDELFAALESGKFPELDANGKIKYTTSPVLAQNDAAAIALGSGPNGEAILSYTIGSGSGPGADKITGYTYDDGSENGKYVEFTEEELAMLPTYQQAGQADGEYFPVIVDGKIKLDYTVSSTDTDPAYSAGANEFEVAWKYEDAGDPSKITGYTLTKYKTVQLTADEQTKVNAVLDAGEFPVIENGALVYEMQTIDSATAQAYEGVHWIMETEGDPESKVLGYKLGDNGPEVLFANTLTSEELAMLTPGRYPELKLDPLPSKLKGNIGLELRVNDAKTGLELVDTTGSYSQNVVFADYGGKVAAMLGFATNSASSKVQGSDLHIQTVSQNTKLADLNGGQGLQTSGSMLTVTNTAGVSYTYVFDTAKPETLGDIIDTMNLQMMAKKMNVVARINDAGDGVMFAEYALGSTSDFSVTETGKNNVAKALGIQTGTVKRSTRPVSEDGTAYGTLQLTGTTKYTVHIEKTDSLDKVREKINALGAGFKATIINDGSDKPYRLSITGSSTGAAGKMTTDFSALGLGSAVMTKAQDAVVLFGDPESSSSVILNSKTNVISGTVPGITLTINGTSTTPVNVWTEKSSVDIKTSLSEFVKNYNKYRTLYNELTAIDLKAGTKGHLAMDSTITRLEADFNELILKNYVGLGSIKSLADVGVTLTPAKYDEETGEVVTSASGMLEFDEDVFDRLYASDPDSIQEFFAKTQDQLDSKGEIVQVQVGIASMFEKLRNAYSEPPSSELPYANSALVSKYDALQRQIEANEERISFLDARLEAKRQILLKRFYAMETAMAKMQSDMGYIEKMAASGSSS